MKPTYEELELQLEESQREFLAADATIHNLELKLTDMAVQLANAESKCRELAGLVAENADLKSLIEQHAGSIAVCPNCSHEEPSETDDIVALYRSLKTPATDAFLAEVRAQGVDYAIGVIEDCANNLIPGGTGEAVQYAQEMVNPYLDSINNKLADKSAQLRKGAAL
ncbi:hypothetical protein DJ269_09640 [Salmonella enterica subsp. enterica serovar Kimberley]|nr:hypothetical protein [Salmonella enterica subsp. enterica serovar Kimberley]EEE9158837.1 hypothetical protein [Salmonella enterica subsp. enterica serovar Kimberley]